ncbi:MAG: GAF domain-containing protein [Deltaproteobacteria bacterium]|nr:GAF domain-containing protein [Deltaproteobacteria bacterium]
MPLEVQSALIAAIVTIAVMGSLVLRRRRRRADMLFAVLSVILILWFLAIFLRGTYGPEPWLRVGLALAALLPAATAKLFNELVPWGTARGRTLKSSASPLSGFFALVAISPLGDFLFTQIAVGVFAGGTVLLISKMMMESSDIARGTVEYARRRYLAIGAAVATILAILGEIPELDAGAIGHVAVMLYLFFLSQVLLRDRLLDLNEFLGRMIMLSILAVFFAIVTAVLVGLGTTGSSRLFNAVVSVIILLTLYEPLKDRLETKMLDLFFRERYRFAQTIEDLRRRMQHGVIDPAKMSQIVVDTLYDTRRTTHVAVYLLEPLGDGFVLHSHRGSGPAPRVNAVELPALWQAIQQNRAPLLAEHLDPERRALKDTARTDLVDAFVAVSADVLLPFVSGDSVLGFLAIRDDRSPEPFSTAEIASLMQIAETAATVIWNSKLADRLRERERLAAIGSMAAGLAHEIRNPLGAIKGAAEYLDPKSLANAEESEFLQVIIDETNRLNSVVSQFLDYARPFRAKLEPTELNEVLRKTAKLIEASRSEPIDLILNLDEQLPSMQVDSEQIKQVILNLVLNAIDANMASGRPDADTLPIGLTTRFLREHDIVEIRVEDKGPGIPREDLERIFIPFFTTKSTGTGLGLAVCQRIIMNHGGTIYPESIPGSGTSFVIRLPLERGDAMSTTGAYAHRGAKARSSGAAPSAAVSRSPRDKASDTAPNCRAGQPPKDAANEEMAAGRREGVESSKRTEGSASSVDAVNAVSGGSASDTSDDLPPLPPLSGETSPETPLK